MAAWTESSRANDGTEGANSTIWVKDLRDANAAARRVSEPAHAVHGLAWSRDGRLAFVATSDSPGQLELYVSDKPGRAQAA